MIFHRFFAFLLLFLVISNCDATYKLEEEPVYLKVGDTYVINRKYLSSVDDNGNYGYGFASYYEDGQVGLFESNKVYRLDITVKEESLLVIKPILSGETKLILAQKVDYYSTYGHTDKTILTTYFIIRG
ncbi:MAG: hypothetical protein GW823_01305 [Bacteroidetes bacterium]|nr:hypothetical protein [Bacteroidota bacterium]